VREKHEVEAKVMVPQGPFVLCDPPMTREEWLERHAAKRLGAQRETP
jgi:hypothetical protein